MEDTLEISTHQRAFADLVKQYYAEIDNGDLDRVVALFEVDAEYFRPGYEQMSGRDAIRSFYVDDRIIESGVHTVESIVSDAGTVAVAGSFKGIVRGGTEVEVKFAEFFRPGPNGLIKKRRTYFYAAQV
jgi:ketosteroid isomerase-like protein